MKLKIFILISLTLAFLSIAVYQPALKAANGQTVQREYCLSAEALSPHDATVTGSNLPPNQDVYIIGCRSATGYAISSTSAPNPGDLFCVAAEYETLPGGYYKTTVKQEMEAKGYRNLHDPNEVLPGDVTLKLLMRDRDPNNPPTQIRKNPVKTDSSGKITVNLFGTTTAGNATVWREVEFFAIAFMDIPTVTPELTPITGEGSTIQYGTLIFPTTVMPQDANSVCVAIRWDPYGRIFDAKSLEPLPNATVELLNSDRQRHQERGVENPQQSKDDGEFTFFVSNGIYYLNPSKQGYSFPISLNEIQPNYTKAYYDIYNSQTPIKEENQSVHVDVPMNPLGTPYRSEVKIMEYTSFNINSSPYLRIQGHVSHPLTVVSFSQDGKEITRVTSDKIGRFVVSIPHSSINPYSPITTYLYKPDLTANIRTNTPVLSKIAFDPIPVYLEGFAYDDKGQIIPSAKVQILSASTKGIHYETVADDKGFFKIASIYLPIMNYYLAFTTPLDGKQVIVTPSQFAAKNRAYSEEKKVNLLAWNDSPLKEQKKIQEPLPTKEVVSPPVTQPLPPQFASSVFASYLLIILLLILVVIIIWFILKAKAKPVA